MIIENMKGKVVDIDNASEWRSEHEIYMKIPEGYDEVINPRVDKKDCLILQKAIVVARMIIENMKGKVVDIDNTFLNGDLEHEIYMMIPDGYDEVINPRVDKEDCLILQKAIYGLVQAARQFWKKFFDKMQQGGFKLSEADPCMLYKEDEKGVCIISLH